MPIETIEPKVKSPWPPQASNDPLYRYPKPYPVGRDKGESFSSIAKKHKIAPADLVMYNFRTKNSGEINWYLANYVRCPPPKPGQKYFEFLGAPYDPVKNTGVIFIPMHGESLKNSLNRLGERIVDNYNDTANKEPGGLCYETCYARVEKAANGVGITIPVWSDSSTFSIIWGSLIAQPGWKDIPEYYKGLGAAGAMVWAGQGTLVDTSGVWRGGLEPGAVIQVWGTSADYEAVRQGHSAYGHSFVFLNYVYSGSAITGMAIADQGFQNDEALARGDWGVWFGANLFKKPGRELGHVRHGPNP